MKFGPQLFKARPLKPPFAAVRRSREMTMIAGASGHGGVMLCADSQETVSDYAKKYVHKITDFDFKNFHFACAGSGRAEYVDMLIQQIDWRLHEVGDADFGPSAAHAMLQEELAKYYTTHVWPRGATPDRPDVSLLAVLGSKSGGVPYLFHTSETAVNWIQGHVSIGIGQYLADYLFDHFFSPHGSQFHMLSVGAYIANKVRKYIEGCGGESQVILFKCDGTLLYLGEQELTQLETVLDNFDECTKEIFHGVTDVQSRTRKPDAMERAIEAFRTVEAEMERVVEQIQSSWQYQFHLKRSTSQS